MQGAVASSPKGVVLHLSIVPEAQHTKLAYDSWARRLRLWIKAPPREGKANQEVAAFFNELFGECWIISGLTSRKKSVLIPGKNEKEVIEKLEEKISKT
ncbi:DUF167 family protein [Candidatus Altiarchaeota archaeon]